jgi:hypothetical protein
MRIPGIKAVSVTGILLVALFTGCSKSNTANGGPADSSPTPPGSVITSAAIVVGADGIAINDYTVVSSTRISRTVYEYTYKADVSNWGTGDAAITASLASTAANVTVLQPNLDFGDVAEGDTKQSPGTFVVRIDRSQPFDDSALTWTVQATLLPPTPYQLIDNAVASGAIDAETGLVYKVFHDFRDSRLPAQYVGREDPTSARESHSMRDVMMNFNTLSAATQDLLLPFLLPPSDPASWYQLRLSQLSTQVLAAVAHPAAATPMAAVPCTSPFPSLEGTILTRNGKVCVHYWTAIAYPSGTAATDADLQSEAQGLADEIDNTIWPRLTALFGVPPIAPGGQMHIYIQTGQAVEISFGATGILGFTTSPICGPDALPFIYIEHGISEFFETAAHEMTHAINDRISTNYCGTADYQWLQEATATWAEHFVYPGHQTEQEYAHSFLNLPAVSLETRGNNHEYASYLLFLYMTKGHSLSPDPDTMLVPAVWNALGGGSDVLHAIDSTIGGLKDKWHDFALYNWNRYIDTSKYPTIGIVDATDTTCSQPGQPYAYYANWDCLRDAAKESTGASPTVVKLNGAVAAVYLLPHKINHLGAKYFHYDFTQDSKIQRVRFLDPYSADHTGHIKVQAIVKTDSGWQKAQDWTGLPQKTLCRDRTGEKFRELVIVISNSEFENRNFVLQDDGGTQPVQTKLQVSALGCRNWKGSVQGRFDNTDPTDLATATTDAQNVTFEKVTDVWTDTNNYQTFQVNGGSVNWTYNENQNFGIACSGNFSGTYGVALATLEEAKLSLGVDPPQGGAEQLNYYINVGMIPVSGGGSWTVSTSDYYLTCPDLPGYQGPTLLIGQIAHWFSVADANMTNLPGIYDAAQYASMNNNAPILDYNLEGRTTFVLQNDPYRQYMFTWLLTQNGSFDSDQ